jgi:hypothetical protein
LTSPSIFSSFNSPKRLQGIPHKLESKSNLTSINIRPSTKSLQFISILLPTSRLYRRRRRKKHDTHKSLHQFDELLFLFFSRSLTMSPNVAKLTQQQANKRWRRKQRRQQKIVFEVIEDDLNLSLNLLICFFGLPSQYLSTVH